MARGITPAWAGKRRQKRNCTHSNRDHPRVGGEKRGLRCCHHCVIGSPPRGRGKAPMKCLKLSHKRITPAWAGKRSNEKFCRRLDKDHPRVGGEKSLAHFFITQIRGSPPRGRGKALEPHSLVGLLGITPAWAGKRRKVCRRRLHSRDHPRVGGEKIKAINKTEARIGSPPRGRGKG